MESMTALDRFRPRASTSPDDAGTDARKATVDTPLPGPSGIGPSPTSITASLTESHQQLTRELRRLTRVATLVAILTSPSVYYWFHHHNGWGIGESLLMTIFRVAVFRGFTDILVRPLIPWPSLFGTDHQQLREEDVVSRRRSWTWSWFFRWFVVYIG